MDNKEAIWRIKDHMIVHKLNEPRAILITEALNMAIKALETLEEFERAQIITGGRLNGRTYAYKCGLEGGKRKALEQQSCDACCGGNQEEKARLCQKSYFMGMKHKLDKEPCEDAISRQAVIDMTGLSNWFESSGDYISFVEEVCALPSVQPKSPWIRIEFKGDALNCPLPDDGERVFLRFKNGYVKTDTCQITIDEEDNTCYGFEDNPDFEDIDAWMKIPE